LHLFLIYPMHITCFVHIMHGLDASVVCGEECCTLWCVIWSCSFCAFHPVNLYRPTHKIFIWKILLGWSSQGVWHR
jgi:hypothetical protein